MSEEEGQATQSRLRGDLGQAGENSEAISKGGALASGELLEGDDGACGTASGASPDVRRRAAAVAREVLQGLLRRMDLDADAAVQCDMEVVVEIVGPDASRVVGRRGEALDALQLIASKIVSREMGQGVPLLVDAGGYRARRADALVQLAQRLREEVLSSGQIVALNPMSARDRRTIHMTLRESPGVSTRSEGEGLERRLLIVPERQ